MANCKKCKQPLTRGNIRVVTPKRGRSYRVHRKCPNEKPVIMDQPAVLKHMFSGGTGDSPVNAYPPSTTGEFPKTVEYRFPANRPAEYRFFMTPDQAERLKQSLIAGRWIPGFGVGFEIIPVPVDQYEANPDAFLDYVEVNINWND